MADNKKTNKRGKGLDSIVYWLVMLVMAALSVTGVMFLIQPVEQILSIPIATVLVGLLLYVAIKNR